MCAVSAGNDGMLRARAGLCCHVWPVPVLVQYSCCTGTTVGTVGEECLFCWICVCCERGLGLGLGLGLGVGGWSWELELGFGIGACGRGEGFWQRRGDFFGREKGCYLEKEERAVCRKRECNLKEGILLTKQRNAIAERKEPKKELLAERRAYYSQKEKSVIEGDVICRRKRILFAQRSDSFFLAQRKEYYLLKEESVIRRRDCHLLKEGIAICRDYYSPKGLPSAAICRRDC